LDKLKGFKSKGELVYDSLLSAIVNGDLAPNSRLVISELGRRLGVSAIPVREALNQLQADGFVSIISHQGASVTPMPEGLVYEVFWLLTALESISSRVACQNMSDADFDEIERQLREADQVLDDPDHFTELNVRLHEFICDRAGTPLVGQLISKVLMHWDRLRRQYLDDVFADRTGIAQRQHWDMLQALRSRDADAVEAAIREHNASASSAYGRVISEKCPPPPPHKKAGG